MQIQHILKQLSLKLIVLDGLSASALFCGVVLGSLKIEPHIWYTDYPPAVQKRAGAQTLRGKRWKQVMIAPMLVLFILPPVLSNLRLKRHNGNILSFPAAAIHAYCICTVVNLVDTALLDYVLFTRIQPDFVMLPGTEDMDFRDLAPVKEHMKNFAKGLGWSLPISLLAAGITKLFR